MLNNPPSPLLREQESVKLGRRRTFIYWSHQTKPSSAQMIEAGFFCCNVGDRTICIYCNLICQQWTPETDDPWEIHKILSPSCPYVTEKLARSTAEPMVTNANSTPSSELTEKPPYHPNFEDQASRDDSFPKDWPEKCPFVSELTEAGFFYAVLPGNIRCFHCNGTIPSWTKSDSPIIEHARRFPHCTYIKNLCGEPTFTEIQTSRNKQESQGPNGTLIQGKHEWNALVLAHFDEGIRSRFSRFKTPIIQQCRRDQISMKSKLPDWARIEDNIATSDDLYFACLILEKQLEFGSGANKKNIVILSRRSGPTLSEQDTNTIADTSGSSSGNLVMGQIQINETPLSEWSDELLEQRIQELGCPHDIDIDILTSPDQPKEK